MKKKTTKTTAHIQRAIVDLFNISGPIQKGKHRNDQEPVNIGLFTPEDQQNKLF